MVNKILEIFEEIHEKQNSWIDVCRDWGSLRRKLRANRKRKVSFGALTLIGELEALSD